MVKMALLASQRLAHKNVIHVMDREADDYSLFHNLTSNGERFVVRARCKGTRTRMVVHDDFRQLHEAVASMEAVVERDVKPTTRKKHSSPTQDIIHPPREPRLTKLSMPQVLPRFPPTIALNVVRVWEPTPPPGEAPVEWVLLTTDPITTVEQLLKIVDRYRARRTIEEYFKALKTGCAYEHRQPEDHLSLANALAVFAPIACTLLTLRTEARRVPDAPAQLVLSQPQIEVLRVLGRMPLPENPTQRDVLLAVAALGGHIKWNGDPGWLTLARGSTERNQMPGRRSPGALSSGVAASGVVTGAAQVKFRQT